MSLQNGRGFHLRGGAVSREHLLDPDEVAYRTCSCEHCPEIAIGTAGAICGDCEAAGCTAEGCEREDEILAEWFYEQKFQVGAPS